MDIHRDSSVPAFFFLLTAMGLLLIPKLADRVRMGRYFRRQGGRLVWWSWFRYGAGVFRDKSNLYYEIRYLDADGNLHTANCHTWSFSGLRLSKDRIFRPGDPIEKRRREEAGLAALKKEKQRLRAERKRTNARRR